MAAAACGFATCVLLCALLFIGADNPPGWAWLQHAAGGDKGATVVVLGTPLVLCLLGLVTGGVNWTSARRRGTRTRVAKLSIVLGLVGPAVLLASCVVMYVAFLLSSPLRPPD